MIPDSMPNLMMVMTTVFLISLWLIDVFVDGIDEAQKLKSEESDVIGCHGRLPPGSDNNTDRLKTA